MWAGAFFSLFLMFKLYGTVDWNSKRKAVSCSAQRLPYVSQSCVLQAAPQSQRLFALPRRDAARRPPASCPSPPGSLLVTVCLGQRRPHP